LLESALAAADGDDRLAADALIELGAVVLFGDDGQDRAESLWTEALTHYRRIGDRLGVARCQGNLGELVRARGDFDAAFAQYAEALGVWRELGDKVGLGTLLYNLGAAARARGDVERAETSYREALMVEREIGESEGMVYTLSGLAGVALDRGQLDRGVRLLAAAAALGAATGAVILESVDREQVEEDVAAARVSLGEQAFEAAWDAGLALPLEAALAQAFATDAAAKESTSTTEPRTASAVSGLTERELEVLRLVVAGRTDREIAEALFIGRRTAQGHVANIMAKFGVNSRTAAATAAIAAGFVAAGPDPAA
jgi:DNA-binding CsgD family transcriptional regulator